MTLKRLLIAMAVLLTATINTIAPVQSASAVLTSPDYAFFFTPHQDDEVLSMGAAIKEYTDAGRPVFVVLLTDGGSSQYCIPQYGTRAACVAERDKEFTQGVQSMGGIPIIRSDRMIDGTLTVAYAQRIIALYHANYPNASLRTMSQYDASPDHSNLGKALNYLLLYPLSRWYIKQSERSGQVGAFTAQYDQNATLDLYPFGHISVPGDFAVATYPTGNYSKFYTH